MEVLIHAKDSEMGCHFVYEAKMWPTGKGIYIFIPYSKTNMKPTIAEILKNCDFIKVKKEF